MRTKLVHIRVTEEEHEILSSKAKVRGLSVSAYLRDVAMLDQRSVGRPVVGRSVIEHPVSIERERVKTKRARVAVEEVGKNVPIRTVEAAKESFKAGEAVDQWGMKRSLAKPCKKK
jgi:hypothetical protein